MKKYLRKWLIIPLPVIALIFELLPCGVKMVFSDGPDNNFKQYVYSYSYFHIMPLAYGIWGPMITGVLTAIITVLAIIWIVRKKKKRPIAIIVLSVIACCTSLWIFAFNGAYSWISWVISSILIAESAIAIIIGSSIH